MQACNSVEIHVVIILSQLGSSNTLQMCGEVFGMVKNKTSIIVGDFCASIRNI